MNITIAEIGYEGISIAMLLAQNHNGVAIDNSKV
tara:strand:- start:393 stop:494 length:102 start_codon:yes stop_codon:yes gene_type:complete